MWNTSRGLRETVIRALAKVGLVWAVAVLGFMFTGMSAMGQHPDSYALSSASAHAQSKALSVSSGDSPRTAGLLLALVVLGGGVTVLAVGATRGDREVQRRYAAADPEPALDLPLALGLGLLA